MKARTQHFDDERLFDCYLSEQAGEAADPRIADHLADCDGCRIRFERLGVFLERLRADADAESDAVFTPEHLHAQHQQIARRLEHVGRAAKVITFPGHPAGPHEESSSPRIATRWIAAAAAAGLFVGVGLGVFYDGGRRTAARGLNARATVSAPAGTAGLAHLTSLTEGTPAVSAEDAFLSDLEAALERPRTRELQPFDALTPHVREVVNLR